MSTKLVTAHARGFDGLVMREEGETFDMPENASGSWFKDAGKDAKATGPKAEAPPDPGKMIAKAQKSAPKTLSGASKG